MPKSSYSRRFTFSFRILLFQLVLILIYLFQLSLKRGISKTNGNVSDIPKNLYCFWTGHNEMSEHRRKCFETLKNSGFTVLLITEQNLSKFILPYAPIHPAYKYLSETHKADYLRVYFMHFYGGGYADIKNTSKSWIAAWNDINSNLSVYGNGYSEGGRYAIANVPDKQLNTILHDNWKLLIGNCCYIFRARTRFTSEWYTATIKVLDAKLEQLKRYPARKPQERYSNSYPYPLMWTELLGQIFHPLCYKYRNRILHSLPKFEHAAYR